METARDEVTTMLRRLPALQGEDPFLQWRGRRFDARVLLQADDDVFRFDFQNGCLVSLKEGAGLLQSWDFALRGAAEAWLQHWRPTPPPGFHDIFAMAKFGRLSIEGNLHPLIAHLQFVKDVLALPRSIGAFSA